MAKIQKLTAIEVRNAKTGRYGDGGGVWLHVREDGQKTWSFRYTFELKRREMGLGSLDKVSLKKARKKAGKARELIADGKDPIEAKLAKKRGVIPTFAECADRFIEMNKASWSNPKHAQQWKNTITTYATPTIGKIRVDRIVTKDIVKILEPIWTTKTETAARLRGRVERVLSWAASMGYRSTENPARWRDCLANILPKPSAVRVVKHHEALPWQDVPAFMKELRKREGQGAQALELAILGALRSQEVRLATWSEFDLDARIWTIPGDHIKSVGPRDDHRVPLSDQAMTLLESLYRYSDSDLLFPSNRRTPISDMTLNAVTRRMKVNCVPHGFRSSFKDWCSESTTYADIVSEMALAHVINNKVHAAYRRGSLFSKRKVMMQAWADYLDKEPSEGAEVVPIGVAK